jgi:hypothetical protein
VERRLELRLPGPLAGPLLDLLLPLAREEGAEGLAAIPNLDAIEEDFRDQWRAELAEALGGDMSKFVTAFESEDFRAKGSVFFAEPDWEPLLRACAALRLKLRRRSLGAIGDTALETGDLEPADLNADTQLALAAYMFLATLQEILIRQLDAPAEPAEEADENGDESADDDSSEIP